MSRLPNTVINRWTGKVPHWRDIDPYSELEDEGSDSPTDKLVKPKKCTDTDSDLSDVAETVISGRELRPRRRHYVTERPHRNTSKDCFYQGLCAEKPSRSISSRIRSLSLMEPSVE